jgi:hypothetical protein
LTNEFRLSGSVNHAAGLIEIRDRDFANPSSYPASPRGCYASRQFDQLKPTDGPDLRTPSVRTAALKKLVFEFFFFCGEPDAVEESTVAQDTHWKKEEKRIL